MSSCTEKRLFRSRPDRRTLDESTSVRSTTAAAATEAALGFSVALGFFPPPVPAAAAPLALFPAAGCAPFRFSCMLVVVSFSLDFAFFGPSDVPTSFSTGGLRFWPCFGVGLLAQTLSLFTFTATAAASDDEDGVGATGTTARSSLNDDDDDATTAWTMRLSCAREDEAKTSDASVTALPLPSTSTTARGGKTNDSATAICISTRTVGTLPHRRRGDRVIVAVAVAVVVISDVGDLLCV